MIPVIAKKKREKDLNILSISCVDACATVEKWQLQSTFCLVNWAKSTLGYLDIKSLSQADVCFQN